MTDTMPEALPVEPATASTLSDWDRSLFGEFRIKFGAPEGKDKPRRLTAQHVHEFNAYMEKCAEHFWETVDQKKPYAVDEGAFRSRYGYVAVDTGPIS